MFILKYNTINNFQNSWKIKLLKIQNFRKIKTIPNYSHAALYIYCQRNRMGAEMEVFLKAKTKQNSACPLGYAVPPKPCVINKLEPSYLLPHACLAVPL